MGPWESDLPFGKPEGVLTPAAIDVSTLTDGELSNLAGYRHWICQHTPVGHLEYDASRARLAEAVAEQRRREVREAP